VKTLLFGRQPGPDEAPGKRTEFPINWGWLRFAAGFIPILWIGLSLYGFLKHGLPAGRRWLLFFIVSAFCAVAAASVIRQYRRAVNVVFTSEGIWTPAGGGRFLPWAQVTNIRLRNARDLELQHPGGRYRINAVSFSDPYSVSRFIRSHVGESAGEALPVSGQI